jgi:hypothetical protein
VRHQTLKNSLVSVDAISQLDKAIAVQGIGVDMTGWDSVAFIAAVNAQGNGGTFDMRVVGSANSNFNNGTNTNGTNISGANIAQAANGAVNVTYTVEVYRPTNRYVKAIYTPTNNANFSAVAIRTRGQSRQPVTITTNHQYVGVAEN